MAIDSPAGSEDRFIRYGWPLAQRYVNRVHGIRPGIEVEDEAAVFGELGGSGRGGATLLGPTALAASAAYVTETSADLAHARIVTIRR